MKCTAKGPVMAYTAALGTTGQSNEEVEGRNRNHFYRGREKRKRSDADANDGALVTD